MAKRVTKPLRDKKILVTRPKHQAGEFSRLLRKMGARPIEFPVIEIQPLELPGLVRFIKRFCAGEVKYNYVIFTSQNGVQDFFRRAGRTGAKALQATSVVAIGPKTAAALKRHRVSVRAVPEKYIAESVAQMLGARNLHGKRILLLRASGAREVLPKKLRASGATVTAKSLYEAVPAQGEPQVLRKLLREVDFVTVTSGSTVRALLAIAAAGRTLNREQARRLLGKAKLASIGPVTSRVARRLGFRVHIEAKEYTISGLAEAIVRYAQTEC